jgi:hypothetical protein
VKTLGDEADQANRLAEAERESMIARARAAASARRRLVRPASAIPVSSLIPHPKRFCGHLLPSGSGRAGFAVVRRPPMREASATDIFIDLPDVGTFRYARRQIGDRLAIRRDYLRYTQEFADDDPDLSLYAALIATHEVLCVDCPEGWENIAALDAGKLDKAFELGFS